jgi:hypothetical protein
VNCKGKLDNRSTKVLLVGYGEIDDKKAYQSNYRFAFYTHNFHSIQCRSPKHNFMVMESVANQVKALDSSKEDDIEACGYGEIDDKKAYQSNYRFAFYTHNFHSIQCRSPKHNFMVMESVANQVKALDSSKEDDIEA